MCPPHGEVAPLVGVANPAASFPELRGESASGLAFFALDFGSYPVHAATETKFAWHVTGAGPLSLVAISPTGQRVDPAWGPEPHTGSNWRRPGDEWGAGFRFPAAGCWVVRAMRRSSVATVAIKVVG